MSRRAVLAGIGGLAAGATVGIVALRHRDTNSDNGSPPLRAIDAPGAVVSIVFSPDGQILAGGSLFHSLPNVYLWKAGDGSTLQRLTGHTKDVNAVAFSPDGQTLATASEDETVRLWRVSDGTALWTRTDHTGSVKSITFSPDGRIIASGAADTTLRLRGASDGAVMRTLPGGKFDVKAMAFSPDGQTLASADFETLTLWRVSDGTALWANDEPEIIHDLAFTPDGQSIAVALSGAGQVRLRRVSDRSLLQTFAGTSIGGRVAFAPNGQTLATILDSGIAVWRVSDGMRLQTLKVPGASTLALAYNPAGNVLAVGTSGPENTPLPHPPAVVLWSV